MNVQRLVIALTAVVAVAVIALLPDLMRSSSTDKVAMIDLRPEPAATASATALRALTDSGRGTLSRARAREVRRATASPRRAPRRRSAVAPALSSERLAAPSPSGGRQVRRAARARGRTVRPSPPPPPAPPPQRRAAPEGDDDGSSAPAAGGGDSDDGGGDD